MRILTVRELTQHIKNIIDKDYLLANVWVKGEISNFKAASSGHFYFTLKDSASTLKVVMFRSKSRSLAFRPDNGMAVIVRGYVSVYERDGTYQFYAGEIQPDGTGALHLAFEQLKERLQSEGLFDQKYKKKLPLLPRRIGIVTSPTGAAVRDMVEIIRRRWSGLQIILVPVLVQGESAPPDIARGIQLLNRWGGVDVIITGRGGGSLEELWAFNTEIVARSIYNSDIPVISAVGHETDYTIADFVADARAATPSAAAEMAVPDKREMDRYIKALNSRLCSALNEKAAGYRQRLNACLAGRVFTRPVDVICGTRQQTLDFLCHRLKQGITSLAGREEKRLAILAGQLQALSPLATLARGYSICTTPDGKHVISEAGSVEIGEKLAVRLQKGILDCIVEGRSS
ncbi:exodeoxyribonuclease VII large subunit [Pelotomaculum propionicicum]|uniref:exodeoxyribonuclease VII large subunit n=1 Tax=Pelotomaculum propionicicum TaxID=258475 RepID=UPI003B7F7026